MNQDKNIQWKYIEGYEQNYLISNNGQVKSLKNNKERILKPTLVGDGYEQVTLFNNGKRKCLLVHVLVAEYFIEEKRINRLIVVDHKDNNRLNNNVDNLQIISQRLNTVKDKKGTSKYPGVCFEKSTGKFRSEIRINNKKVFLGRFLNEKEASEQYNIKLKELENENK